MKSLSPGGRGLGEGGLIISSKSKAQRLRENQTDAKRKLWSFLRNHQLCEFKFRRQVPMGKYVVDFICHEKNLIIEMDGGLRL